MSWHGGHADRASPDTGGWQQLSHPRHDATALPHPLSSQPQELEAD